MTEYIPFEPEMVGRDEIIIWCPDELKSEMTKELMALGCKWLGGQSLDEYIATGKSYHVRLDKLVTRSPKDWYEEIYARRHLCLFVEYGTRKEESVYVVDLI